MRRPKINSKRHNVDDLKVELEKQIELAAQEIRIIKRVAFQDSSKLLIGNTESYSAMAGIWRIRQSTLIEVWEMVTGEVHPSSLADNAEEGHG